MGIVRGAIGVVGNPTRPALHISRLKQPVGSDLSTAFALSTGVRQQHCIAGSQKHGGVGRHALAVIPNAMQQDDRIPIPSQRLRIPPLEFRVVCALELDIRYAAGSPLRNRDSKPVLFCNRTALWMKRALHQQHAPNGRQEQVDSRRRKCKKT